VSKCIQCNGTATPQVFVSKRVGTKINSRRYRYLQCDACKIEWVEKKEVAK
jgi:hypothetical protein